jgi:hypothetical protein
MVCRAVFLVHKLVAEAVDLGRDVESLERGMDTSFSRIALCWDGDYAERAEAGR